MALDIEKVEMIVMEAEEKLEKSADVFMSDLTQVRAGRANPHVLDKIRVDYYGTPSPINQVGNIAVTDGQCLVITPWDKSLLKIIEKAIQVSDIGINPTNDGNVIRLVFPTLTEERRKEIVKQVKKMAEDAKVAVRNVRRDALDALKKMNKAKEMTDDEYADFMVWHRGLAVPAVRNVHDENVLRGRELFTQIGCAECHRPSWTTGADHIQDPNKFFKRNSDMPRYPYQTIWPYTDFVQHKLCMEKDIRTGWCRTTPLWGRGLHKKITGDAYEARLHDTRARTTVEAIMWHGYSEESDALESVKKFYNLTKKDRDALVAFINAI